MMQNEKQVVLQPTSEPCFDFMPKGIMRLKKTVIIAPIKIEEYGKGKYKITYGCSRGAYCKDLECRYVEYSEMEKEAENVTGVETFSSQLDR